jgi:PAS domain S-box-containing protein
MKLLKAPSDKLLTRQLRRYFTPIALILLLVSFGTTATILYKETNKNLAITRSEIIGVQYHHALFDLMVQLQKFRTKTFIAERSGKLDPELSSLEKEVGEQERVVDSFYGQIQGYDLLDKWHATRVAINTGLTSTTGEDANQRFIRQTDAINSLLLYMKDVGYRTKLSNDPDEDTNYRLDTLTLSLPGVVRILSTVRGKMSGDLASPTPKLDFFEVQRYFSALKGAYADYTHIVSMADVAAAAGPEDSAMADAMAYMESLSKKDNTMPLPSSEDFFNTFSKPIEAFINKYDSLSRQIYGKLLARQRQQTSFQFLILGILTSTFALSVTFLFIARRNMVQKDLVESSLMKHAVLASASCMMIAVDKKGAILLFNREAEHCLGYTAREVVNKHTLVLWHDQDEIVTKAKQLSLELNRTVTPGIDVFIEKVSEEHPQKSEWTLIRKDGSRFPANLVVSPLTEENGTVVGYLGVINDITQIKADETKLRESEDLFRAAMEYAVIGQALVSPEGKWLKVNKSLCEMLGYTEQELLVIDFQSITHPHDLKKDWDNVIKMLNHEMKSYHMEKRYFHKSGEIIWALLNVSLIWNADKTPKHFISQIQNITEQKKLITEREELIKKLTESNTALERFAYVASHDMQEPIRMITNFSGIIATDYADKIDETGREYLRLLVNSGTRLRELVDDLLAYARVGNETVKSVAFDGENIIEGVLENLQNLITDQKAQVTHDELPKMSGNPVQIMRLLQNFISNAIKYQPKDNVPRVHIGVKDDGSHWLFSVKDNGLGIKPEFIEQIFQPFRRLHAWEQIHGTGLGLSICKKIIEMHGGEIRVESEPGKGSTFHFTIRK